MMAERFTVSGVAVTADPGRMLDEICTHFVEHGTVTRNGDAVTVETMIGKADISRDGQALAIELSCRSARALQNVRAILAEHLFGFAGEETLELTWSDAPKADRLPDLREIRVIGAKTSPRICAGSPSPATIPGILPMAACISACSFRRRGARPSGRDCAPTGASIGRAARTH